MPDQNEKARRKQIRDSLHETSRNAVKKSLPVSEEIMRSLFDYVDSRLSATECDHTLHFTLEFIRANALSENEVLHWLENAGAYCDCEVLCNAEDFFDEAIGT